MLMNYNIGKKKTRTITTTTAEAPPPTTTMPRCRWQFFFRIGVPAAITRQRPGFCVAPSTFVWVERVRHAYGKFVDCVASYKARLSVFRGNKFLIL